MARGGKGGRRGGGRGKGASGYPPSAQGSATSAAQSGGRATTFQGGKGGAAFGNKGGSAGTGSKGRMRLPNGLVATIRTPGGDSTLVHDAFSEKRGPALKVQRAGAKTNTSLVKPRKRGGAARGYGGSTQ